MISDYFEEDSNIAEFTSEDTIFTIEKVSTVNSNETIIEPLKYDSFFRLKHLKTGSYLTELNRN